MNQKQCTQCRRFLPLDDFHRHSERPDGRNTWCKDCKLEVYCAGNVIEVLVV